MNHNIKLSRGQILTLPAPEVYQRLSAKLWPWDETRCRVCGWFIGRSQTVYMEKKTAGANYEFSTWEKESIVCTADSCSFRPVPRPRADAPPDLACWAGLGLVLEKVFELKDMWITVGRQSAGFHAGVIGGCSDPDWWDFYNVAETPWECVSRAALLALEGE